MKLFRLMVVLLLVPVFIGTAQAQQDVIAHANINWVGFYVGGNMGGGWDTACDNLEPGTTAIKSPSALTNAFYHRDYVNDGTFISGAQIGYNSQYAQSARVFGLDYEAYRGKYRNRTYAYAGASPVPHGTYTFSFFGENTADGFFTQDPGMGDAGDACFPYLRWGGVFTSGSRHISTRFGDTAETATFAGGKNYAFSGFATDNSVLSCPGAAATCAGFGHIDLDNIHNSVVANIFR
jgi:hypothetical protein